MTEWTTIITRDHSDLREFVLRSEAEAAVKQTEIEALEAVQKIVLDVYPTPTAGISALAHYLYYRLHELRGCASDNLHKVDKT